MLGWELVCIKEKLRMTELFEASMVLCFVIHKNTSLDMKRELEKEIKI